MIEVHNLSKTYGDTAAISGISFHIQEGEILGFLGPNGAGKTTTMRILTCFTPPSAGWAKVGGYDVMSQSREVRRILGYLPESAPYYGEMTVRSFVDFFAEAKGLSGMARKNAVGQALEECGLLDVGHRLLMNLSKGYRQRAALAQAIVGDPKVLILDEPTVGLDPRQIREVRSLIRNMAGRRTVILSTHILPEVSLTCSRVVIINRGRVVATGTPDKLHAAGETRNEMFITVRGRTDSVSEVLAKVSHVRHVGLESPEADSPVQNEGSKDDAPVRSYHLSISHGCDIRSEISRAMVEKGFDLLEMRSTTLSLEDVFLHTLADDEEGSRLGN